MLQVLAELLVAGYSDPLQHPALHLVTLPVELVQLLVLGKPALPPVGQLLQLCIVCFYLRLQV